MYKEEFQKPGIPIGVKVHRIYFEQDSDLGFSSQSNHYLRQAANIDANIINNVKKGKKEKRKRRKYINLSKSLTERPRLVLRKFDASLICF